MVAGGKRGIVMGVEKAAVGAVDLDELAEELDGQFEGDEANATGWGGREVRGNSLYSC